MDVRTLFKRYDQVLQEAQLLRAWNNDLQQELRACRPELYRAEQKIDRLEQRVAKLAAENKTLKQRLAELTTANVQDPPSPAKTPLVRRRRKRPGRPVGHPAALRPPPDRIDEEIDVPLGKDPRGRCLCPQCQAILQDVKTHERLVEDLKPATTVIRRYHTISGHCPQCHKRVESRHVDQPPAADLPHAQMGPNALATAASLRIDNHLPYCQITQVMANLSGLKICPAALSRQINRMGGWMKGEYEHLQLQLRKQKVLYADETSWRIQGRGAWLWTLVGKSHTLFHIDKSRGGKVIRRLVGKAFGGHLVTDFYSAYSKMNCLQQRCLTHLLRELHETAAKSPAFAAGSFCRRCRRLLKDMLLLKSRQEKLRARVYKRRVARLEKRLFDLSETQSSNADEMRLAKRLRKYRDQLTPFLHIRQLDGTNNRAERAIRPMVVTRKISGGSRSKVAAGATAVVASVVRTARQQGRHIFQTIKTLLCRAWAGDETPLLTPSG